jgi:hypothetical protein
MPTPALIGKYVDAVAVGERVREWCGPAACPCVPDPVCAGVELPSLLDVTLSGFGAPFVGQPTFDVAGGAGTLRFYPSFNNGTYRVRRLGEADITFNQQLRHFACAPHNNHHPTNYDRYKGVMYALDTTGSVAFGKTVFDTLPPEYGGVYSSNWVVGSDPSGRLAWPGGQDDGYSFGSDPTGAGIVAEGVGDFEIPCDVTSVYRYGEAFEPLWAAAPEGTLGITAYQPYATAAAIASDPAALYTIQATKVYRQLFVFVVCQVFDDFEAPGTWRDCGWPFCAGAGPFLECAPSVRPVFVRPVTYVVTRSSWSGFLPSLNENARGSSVGIHGIEGYADLASLTYWSLDCPQAAGSPFVTSVPRIGVDFTDDNFAIGDHPAYPNGRVLVRRA